ncbi:unnamed protein product [Rhodiola kirilowii]
MRGGGSGAADSFDLEPGFGLVIQIERSMSGGRRLLSSTQQPNDEYDFQRQTNVKNTHTRKQQRQRPSSLLIQAEVLKQPREDYIKCQTEFAISETVEGVSKKKLWHSQARDKLPRKRVEKDDLPEDCAGHMYQQQHSPGFGIAVPVLLVDGYNVCGHWVKLKKYFMSGRLDVSRQKLIDELVTFSMLREVKVVAVFDAMMSGLPTHKESFAGVDIIFSGETCADSWIEKEVVALEKTGVRKSGSLHLIGASRMQLMERADDQLGIVELAVKKMLFTVSKSNCEICASWLRFEREYGTLEDFDHAALKVAPRLEELRLFKLQQDFKSSAVSTDQTQVLNKKALREKRKPDSDSANEQPSAKKKKGADQQLTKGDGNNVSQSTKDVELNRGGGKEVNIVQSSTKPDEDIKKHTQPKAKVFEDKCTAFISNLNVKATPEDLQKFFKDVGGVKDIRILRDKFTKVSRGLAYVDFCDDDRLAAAVAKNRKLLLGKKISIARSNPKRGKESGGNSGSAKGGEAATKDHGQGDGVQLKGKNTFAVPRNVRPLGLQMTTKRPVNEEEGEAEKPKSNDEFRKMFLKE